MKKMILLSLLSLPAFLAASTVMAAPHTETMEFICPATSVIHNLGTFISGTGHEKIDSSGSEAEFTGLFVSGVPTNFSSYSSSGTKYNVNTGHVTCNYVSSGGYPNFDLSYQMANAINGIVTKSSNDEINIKVMIGYRA